MRRRTFFPTIAAGIGVSANGQSKSSFEQVYRLDPPATVVDFVPGGGDAPLVLARTAEEGLLIHHNAENWQRVRLPEFAKSVTQDGRYFWIAGVSGIWRLLLAGGKWEKRWEGEGLECILFLAEKGFATGSGKTILETSTGEEWRRVPAADEPTTNTANTTYHWIHFVTERVGIISGASRPPRKGRTEVFPAWLDRDQESRRKEWPGASLTLETRDGGKTWRHSVTSIFGKITRVRYARNGKGLALLEFHDAFEWPSEVFSIDLKTGASDRVFRRKDRAVTDSWLTPGGGYLAAIEPPAIASEVRQGRVCLFQSEDLHEWKEMPFPKVEAGRVWLAGTPGGALWAATDTGLLFRASVTP
ncbi:MAG: hypothetical protein JST93_05840 [Acidobacteria bacterium]|nr:hypothetical protein [Acidobacteriota bacterium]